MFGVSKNCSKRKSYIFPLVLLLCSNSFCTTAVIVITSKRIVAGTDRLASDLAPSGKLVNSSTRTKIALLKGRFIVACVGLESFKAGPSPDHQVLLYDFLQWIKTIESQIAPNTSVHQLTTIIENESARTFTETIPVETFMKNGTIKYADAWKDFFVQFAVAGFDNGVAALVEVDYKLDWEGKHLIGPTRGVQLPEGYIGTALYSVGQQTEITDSNLSDPNTNGYKRMDVYVRSAVKKLRAGQQISRRESVRVVRELIAIEAEHDPLEVGSGTTVVTLPFAGTGTITQYQTTLALPKTVTTKQRKTSQ